MSPHIFRRGIIASSRSGAAASTGTVLTLPGTNGNYASTPDSVAASITGDIDIRVKLSMADWTPSSTKWLLAKGNSYQLVVLSSGQLYLSLNSDALAAASQVGPTVADGAVIWVRAARVASTGIVTFYSSTDYNQTSGTGTWGQLGSPQGSGAGAITDGTEVLAVGALTNGTFSVNGTVHYAEVRSGINGTIALKFDASGVTILGTRNPTSFVSPTGETWTINGSAWDWATV